MVRQDAAAVEPEGAVAAGMTRQHRPRFFSVAGRFPRPGRTGMLAVMLGWLAGCATSLPAPEPGIPPPEAASGYSAKSGWHARHFIAATANPLATQAGYRILKAGGSAVDAAIAAQMVLTLVEPQSSGIGGGAFLLHYDGHTVAAFDGRETAPAAANETLFQNADGSTLAFYDAVASGRSVGVPGVLRMLEMAHRQHGKLPWQDLFAPAIALAEQGFAVSVRLARLLQVDQHLKKDATAAAYFYDRQGQPWPAGHVLKNPELANTLRAIASGGADIFYTGTIAGDIVAKVTNHPTRPGVMTVEDMQAYRPKSRAAVCADYRTWTVCGMPPPSSGGIAVAQMLGMLETTDIAMLAPRDGQLHAQAVHLFSEAGRLAYADRARYVADPDFAPLPGNSIGPLLDKAYLKKRAALITAQSMGVAQPGTPYGIKTARGQDASPDLPATSQLSIVDRNGHAVSMTSSIEDAFGSRLMVRGFLLNNQLTDFSFVAADAAGPVANRVQPGKRARSSMAPTLVLEKDSRNLLLVAGSPGGSAIINYVTKVLVATLDWGMNVQQAIDLPNFGSRNGPTELEQGRTPDGLLTALQSKGHTLRVMEQTSGVQAIMRIRRNGEPGWFAGADPRREGTAQGD